jgi:hypothetical protein
MGDNNMSSLRLSGVSGGFQGHNFPTGGGSVSQTDTSQGVPANFGKYEVVMTFLSG